MLFFLNICKKIYYWFVNSIVSVVQQKVIIPNKYGEKLVGILHETGSVESVILCHGFRSSKVGVSNMQSSSFCFILFFLLSVWLSTVIVNFIPKINYALWFFINFFLKILIVGCNYVNFMNIFLTWLPCEEKFYSLFFSTSRNIMLWWTLLFHWEMKESVPSVLTSLEMGKLVELQDVNIWTLKRIL